MDLSSSHKPLLQALLGQKPHRTPVWFLRQAGRYLPEYQSIRSQYDFLTVCQNPNLAAEVTLQPLRRFDLDAAIIFSDILLLCHSLGQQLSFAKDHGPQLVPPVRTPKDLAALPVDPPILGDTACVGEAIRLVKQQLSPTQAMIGFAGAPFTVASYMVEGAGSKTYQHVKSWLYQDPHSFKELLRYIVTHTKTYLDMQIAAGADALMLFDTWADQLPPAVYGAWVLPITMELLASVSTKVPVIYFPGGSSEAFTLMKDLPCQGLAVHWRVSLLKAQETLLKQGVKTCLQGNLDPQVLTLNERSTVEAQVHRLWADSRALRHGFIFNVGHGLTPATRPEAVGWALDTVRSLS